MELKIAASLFCACVTVFNALRISKVPPTGRVAVVGIGGLGYLALQFARTRGVHVTGHSPKKKKRPLVSVLMTFCPERILHLKNYVFLLVSIGKSHGFVRWTEVFQRICCRW